MRAVAEVAVGKDVFSVCGKCGPQWHVIVSMSGSKITRVQCKFCSAYHRYKPPEGEAPVDGGSTRRVAGGKRPVAATRAAGGPALAPDPSRPVRSYAMSETYAPGDRLDHPTFGHGVVEATPIDGKMLVYFPSGRRTLAHGRPRS